MCQFRIFFCGSRVSHGTINSSFSNKESNLGPSEYTLGKLEEKCECPLHKVEAVTFRIESFRFKDEKEYGCEIFSKTSACKPASFWREKRDNVIPSSFYYDVSQNVVSKQILTTVVVLAFFDQQKGLVTSNKNN